MFKGCMVALVTPFKDNGDVDEEKLKEIIEFQIKEGVEGIVPCGCTGEAATLSHEEQKMVIRLSVEITAGRVPVIAGTGSNSTEEALDLTRYAKKVGSDGVLLITPYYNKPTPEGQFLHYERIATEVDIPIVLYNVPSRTGISMLPETVERLSKIDNIVAIKEASGSLNQVSEILSLCDITVLSGDDSLTLPMLGIGGKGVISVAANIVPGDVRAMIDAFDEGNLEEALRAHYKLFPLCRAMFIETNPIPVKTAMLLLGRLNGRFRLPLCPLREKNLPALQKALDEYGLMG